MTGALERGQIFLSWDGRLVRWLVEELDGVFLPAVGTGSSWSVLELDTQGSTLRLRAVHSSAVGRGPL